MTTTAPQDFIQERLYFTGVSPRTVDWYKCSFRQFEGALASRQSMMDRIKVLKDRGASHISINSYLRCINAYFNWLHKEHRRELIRIPRR
jgi:site-specific recombinase XerD